MNNNIKKIKFDIKQYEGGTAAHSLIKILQSHGYIAYLAGGCVRDVLLGRIPKDFDIATDCLPEDSIKIFDNSKEIGKSFGVVLINHMEYSFELATFREDFGSLNGRHPRKICFSTPPEDSKRRDFTINSMFYDPISETLYDYNNGEIDLELKLVKFVGIANQRIIEDHLRMLRAVRFESTLWFTMDNEAEIAIKENSKLIKKLSPERIRSEFVRILCEAEKTGQALKKLNDLDLLVHILPQFSKLESEHIQIIYDMLDDITNMSFELAMATIFQFIFEEHPSSNINKISKHLKLSVQQKNEITKILLNINAYDNFYNLPISQKKLLFADSSFIKSIKLLELRCTWGLAKQADIDEAEKFNELNKDFKLPAQLITGQDLISRGMKPGKKIGEILNQIYTEQLDENIETKEDAFIMLDRILDDQ
jgi:poly(A) polymerase